MMDLNKPMQSTNQPVVLDVDHFKARLDGILREYDKETLTPRENVQMNMKFSKLMDELKAHFGIPLLAGPSLDVFRTKYPEALTLYQKASDSRLTLFESCACCPQVDDLWTVRIASAPVHLCSRCRRIWLKKSEQITDALTKEQAIAIIRQETA